MSVPVCSVGVKHSRIRRRGVAFYNETATPREKVSNDGQLLPLLSRLEAAQHNTIRTKVHSVPHGSHAHTHTVMCTDIHCCMKNGILCCGAYSYKQYLKKQTKTHTKAECLVPKTPPTHTHTHSDTTHTYIHTNTHTYSPNTHFHGTEHRDAAVSFPICFPLPLWDPGDDCTRM